MAHRVQIANNLPAGVNQVELPDGLAYRAGQQVTLSDEDFSKLGPAEFTNGTLIDLGETGPAGDQVTTQGAAVTLTSATTANATDLASAIALVNALKVDIAALNTALTGPGKAL